MVSVRIPLSQGKFARVSIQDAERVMTFNWTAYLAGKTHYAHRMKRVSPGKHGRRGVQMHRFILGDKAGRTVDHRDRDGLNNTRSNIRPATQQQQNANQGISTRNTSGVRGVSFRKDKNRWQAVMKYEGKNIHLGYFRELSDAATARRDVEIRVHGEFAPLLDV